MVLHMAMVYTGVNMGAKTGTGTYGAETYSQYNLPDNAAKKRVD